jgi:hypothetical protein
MPTATLALSLALTLGTSALLAYAGALILRRPTDEEAKRALRLFAVWWFSVAAVVLLGGSATILSLAGVDSIRLQTALSYLTAVPLTLALWSLLYYLIFIYTGRPSAIWPLTLAYGVFFAFEMFYFSSFGDRSFQETPYSIRLVAARQPPAWVSVTFGLLLAVPILFVVVGYASLWFRTQEPDVRRRIGLVSSAFALWFGVVLAAFLLGWDRQDWFPLVYQAPGVVAGALVVTAYRR